MTFKNVDVLPATEVVENKGKVSLRTRISSLYTRIGAAATVAVVGSSVHAAEGDAAISFDFVEKIKTAFSSALDGLQSIYGIAIMIVLAIVVFGIMKGGTRKVG